MNDKPVIGVGAAVWKGDRVLMIKRANEPGAGRWSVPGGRLDFGETTEAAAAREVLEETGVTAEITGLVGVYDAFSVPGEMPPWHFTLVNYAARWVSGEAEAGSDALEARFMTLAEVQDLDIWADVMRTIEKSRNA